MIDNVISHNQLKLTSEHCERDLDSTIGVNAGTRNVLAFGWARFLAEKLQQSPHLNDLLPSNSLSVQCNYFSKDSKTNWHVALHRDKSIPIQHRISSGVWSGWSQKEGVLYAQPPAGVLENVVVVRLHLEDTDASNGGLELVCGSHTNNKTTGKRVLPLVAKGGALVMRPLTLHASNKLKSGQRRVLHFVFGPRNLPDGAEWARIT